MYGANVVIFEGILSFYNAEVLKVSKRIVTFYFNTTLFFIQPASMIKIFQGNSDILFLFIQWKFMTFEWLKSISHNYKLVDVLIPLCVESASKIYL